MKMVYLHTHNDCDHISKIQFEENAFVFYYVLKMVNSICVRCDLCLEIITDKSLIFVPSCLICKYHNQKFFFHRFCFYAIYDEDTKQFEDEYKERFKIQCEKCNCELFTRERAWYYRN